MVKYLMLVLFVFPAIALADVTGKQEDEVEHLLDFVKKTECLITRNSTEHKGESAAEHIRKKYDYFSDDIKSAEDFIEYSATKSTLSGQYYTVSCAGKKATKTKDWLLAELKRYREVVLKEAPPSEITICTEPRPQICTREYVPVCASLKGGSAKTMPSGCSACSKSDVVSYKAGECQVFFN
ncbi:hypothetical protein MNBD_GAMMA11-2826 [hydrothermal vent metagenome]|uniref:Kazal-like domain-containing protein n=1 Tax=hydrothermal vent metagenome TaxID=652676 RepID=A0A3B0X161_9ZZZZ